MLSAEGVKPETNNRSRSGSCHVCLYVCMFFLDFSKLRALTDSRVVYIVCQDRGRVLRHACGAVGFPARAWQVIVVPIGLTLWSEQLPSQMHVILALSFRYQNQGIKRIRDASSVCCQSGEREGMQLLIYVGRAQKARNAKLTSRGRLDILVIMCEWMRMHNM